LPNSSCEERKAGKKMFGALFILAMVCLLVHLSDKTPAQNNEVQLPKPTVQVLYTQVDIHFHGKKDDELGFGARTGRPDPPDIK